MELEFDKEMDAILRKARHTGNVAGASPHLDADVIAAFAENALPERAKSNYTIHLADCDPCRKQLSRMIAIRGEDVETAPARPAMITAAEVPVPWYKSLFRTPNLAIAMGGLILVFTGVLGFLIFQNDRNTGSTFVSQVSEQSPASAPTPLMADQANVAANSNTAAAAPGQQTAAVTANGASTGTMASPSANTAAGTTAAESVLKQADEARPAPAEEKSVTARQLNELPRAATAPPPPPPAGVTIDGVAADSARRDAETSQAERSDVSLAAKRKEMDSARSRDVPPAASGSGPARSGPVQMQNTQNARNAIQMSVTRSVGGRKFANRDGAWYDSTYKGQATQNVRRGSDEFKKLDLGLRSIANDIDGVVVVVWRSKAYRIQ